MHKSKTIIGSCAALIFFGALVLVAVFTSTTNVRAATLIVDDSSGQQYTTIQAAINASVAGDTVYVYNGIYNEQITINKSITLTGESNQSTIIRGSSAYNSKGIYITANYVNISNLKVDNFSFGFGIYLSSSSNNNIVSNTLTNCSLGIRIGLASKNIITSNTVTNSNQYGIYLFNASNNIITSNTLANCYYGIHIDSSSNNNITSNTIPNIQWQGIYLDSSSNNNITSNTITKCSDGIYLICSSKNTIASNTITYSNKGIYLHGSNNNVTSNTILNSIWGTYIGYGSNNTIASNTLINCSQYGIYLSLGSNNIIASNTEINSGILILDDNILSNNTINGKPVLYYKNINATASPQVLDNVSANCIILYNCSGFVIKNMVMEYGGILLISSSYNNISSNTITNSSRYGIYLYSSPNNTISSNTIANSGRDGIYLDSSSNNNITSNTVANSSNYGIYLDSSSNNNITSNIITNSSYGIVLYDNSNNTIASNNIYSNKQYGLAQWSGSGNTAYNNWWGSTSGPYNPYNPMGTGDNITNDVPFSPWATTPFNISSYSPTSPQNHAPTITSITANKTTANAGEQVTITTTASDADGDPPTYSYSATGGTITGSGSSVVWTAPTTNDTYAITIVVSDGNLIVTGTINITVVNTPPTYPPINHAPAITSVTTNHTTINISEQITIMVNATDQDNDSLTYNYSTTGGTTSGAGSVINWTAPTTNGTYTITVIVSDWDLTATSTINITVVNGTVAPSVNASPTVTITSSFTGKVNGMVTITGTASDSDGTVQLVQVSIDNDTWIDATGTTSWSYTLNTTTLTNSKHTIKVRVYDETDYSAEQSLEIDVDNAKTSETKKSSGFIPGFEVLVVLSALGVTLALLRRTHNE